MSCHFEQRELKESIDENWEITDKNQDKHEQADGKVKLLEEEYATVKATVTESQKSQNDTNDNIQILEAKLSTLAKSEDQSHGLTTKDLKHVECEMCDVIFANKAQLFRHNKTKHHKRIVCRICDQSFEESFKLEEHLISEHKKNKSYKCMQCECAFVLKS